MNLDSWTPEQMDVSWTFNHWFHISAGLGVILALNLSIFVFRAFSSGEINEQQSFGNVICRPTFADRKLTRTIQKYRSCVSLRLFGLIFFKFSSQYSCLPASIFFFYCLICFNFLSAKFSFVLVANSTLSWCNFDHELITSRSLTVNTIQWRFIPF